MLLTRLVHAVTLAALATGSLTLTSPASASAEPRPADDRATTSAAAPLLEEPQRGPKAIRLLGERLPAAAARNDLRPGELRTMLRADDATWVDTRGAVFFVDPAPERAPAEPESSAATPVAPLAETFSLHSNPAADLTILLDFDGATVSGTAWNQKDGVTPGLHPGWDPSGDGAAFNDTERRMVQQVWAMVAEDYAPFDVDVTTEDPGDDGMVRSSTGDAVYGTRVLVSPSGDAHGKICPSGCGGVAYLGVFDRVGTYAQPAWVFPHALGNRARSVAEAASHEAGHNLGLEHDGTSAQDYSTGHGVWAPIMGVGYHRPLVQWSAGAYPGANNQQDDLSILRGYLGARPDEASDSVATPSPLAEGEALVGTPADVDAYLLGPCIPGSAIQVTPSAMAPNLDVRAALHRSDGTSVAVAQPTTGFGDGTTASGLAAGLTVPTSGDGWVLTVEGAGQGSWTTSGYDDYGSLGTYTVDAPGCGGALADGGPADLEPVDDGPAEQGDNVTQPAPDTAPLAPTGVIALAGNAHALVTWTRPDNDGGSPITGFTVTTSPGGATTTVGAEATTAAITGLTNGSSYTFTVRATNAVGGSPASAPTSPVTPAWKPGRVAKPRAKVRGNTVVLTWRAPTDNGSPITRYSIDNSLGGDRAVSGSKRRVVFKRLKPGTYRFRVTATNAVGTSRLSAAVKVRVRRR